MGSCLGGRTVWWEVAAEADRGLWEMERETKVGTTALRWSGSVV